MEFLKKNYLIIGLCAVVVFAFFTETGKGLVAKAKLAMGF